MLGIVLCGGQSLRMGSDKGTLSHLDKLWAKIAADKITEFNIPVKFSVNPTQIALYAGYFSDEKLVIDHTSLEIKGPLLGLLSAHISEPLSDLLILACDMLNMESRLLEVLINTFNASPSFEAYIFTKDGQQEPLCGIYTGKGLEKILHTMQTKGLAKQSMKFILENLNVNEIEVNEADYHLFKNFNAHAEINGL
ncbi:molybdopterin-guanine dinucleotide biosynthesis protein A [Pedobacter sp. UYP24]